MLSAREIDAATPSLMSAVNYAEYRLELMEEGDFSPLEEKIAALLQRENILLERHSTKGRKTVDVRPSIALLKREGQNIIYGTWLDRGAAIRPAELLDLLLPNIPGWRFIRTGLWIVDGNGKKLLP